MKLVKLMGLVGLTVFAQLSIAEESSKDQAPKNLADCMKIADDAKRLSCFDAVSQKKVKAPEGFELIDLPKPSESKAYREKKSSEPTGFGSEHIKKGVEDSNSDTLTSTIKGKFEGWRGKTKFTLENGQVWQQSQSGTFYVKVTDPTIIIEKGFLGAYYLKVKGYNKRVKVKRIK